MESPNNRKDSVPTRCVTPPSKISSVRNGQYLVEPLDKEAYENSQTT